jgi:XTP/dITP diphosphohydrolase
VASSNQGKLREYRALTEPAGASVELAVIPRFDSLAVFEEIWPTFAENAAGKALHYSRFAEGMVIADDSGLVVPALGGAPGVQSARYAGPEASDADRIRKLLGELRGKKGEERRARFVCVVAVAESRKVHGLFSASVEGILLEEPRGQEGFGYDPIFFFPALGKTYTATVGKRSARRSIFFWVRAKAEEHGACYIHSPHWDESEKLKTLR